MYCILFVRRGFKNSKFYKEYELIKAFCDREILQFFKANFSSNITPKEPDILTITKFHKRSKRSYSVRV